jgi:hypothetical protein
MTSIVEITQDKDNASNMILSIPGALPLATEELDMEAYQIWSRPFPSDLGRLSG